MSRYPRLDIPPGSRFGRLVVLAVLPSRKDRPRRALVRCDCTVEKEVQLAALSKGTTRSCGAPACTATVRRFPAGRPRKSQPLCECEQGPRVGPNRGCADCEEKDRRRTAAESARLAAAVAAVAAAGDTTAQELAAELGVSRKTIERYRARLAELSPPGRVVAPESPEKLPPVE